ncbi:MAG: WGR domain-containing protein [Gammaproteobacteria bacterium]|nr:WGR domain-containing protein [Gammaproteobacteria bacterium]
MRIYMQQRSTEDSAPRFYQIVLEPDMLSGWLVVREWGQSGAAGRVKREHFDHLEDAQKAMIEVRDAQLQRGYQVVFIHGQHAVKP